MNLPPGPLNGSALFLLLALVLTVCTGSIAAANPLVPPDLFARAEAEGSVRVIVELRVGSEGVGAAQDALLRSLASTPHRLTRRFTAIPFLGLEASPEALRLLAGSPLVVRIEEDRLRAPQERTP